ncbi:MAG: citrate lyase holo-[acyl-carrier protein] synthase [Spirochaetaceae bacterium]|nr:citrate lyase holo-[acyl-carrier protein] synthase [Spirochaetaceae bacterium]
MDENLCKGNGIPKAQADRTADFPRTVSLDEVLAFRERRAARQEALLGELRLPLACLGLNIPGGYKDFPWARRAFREEIRVFTLALKAEGIDVLHEEREEEASGCTAYIAAAADAAVLKAAAIRCEETHPLGRLFDIDIHAAEGRKLSREDLQSPPRPCLVCGNSGFACARARVHSPEELGSAVRGIMETWLRQKLADTVCAAAVRAMMSEVAVTPKPGLVDRANNGAHSDMDFFTFIDSTAALLPWFRECAVAGFAGSGKPLPFPGPLPEVSAPKDLFASLRPPGRVAEVLMRQATGGVNTHRGLIFCLGILSASYGRLYRDSGNPSLAEILELCRAMTTDLGEDFSRVSARGLSHGETAYVRSGMRGIRGEVSRGFPTVSGYALPVLRRMLKEGHTVNDAGIAVLLHILAHAEDTNIAHRGGEGALSSVQEDLRAFLAANPGMEALREKAASLDKAFIAANISPGGCADLLGVAFFLCWLPDETEDSGRKP